jgi:flagellin-like hook-associated protein FlgL
MRVPSISMYSSSTYRLGNLTEDLKNSNEVVSTQKQINEISDDPLGLSQTLGLRNSIGNLEQIERNVTMGKSWLQSVESAMGSVNDLILEAKTEATRLANDSTTNDERLSAIERIDNIIEQILTLGNTQVNGNYVFGGTITDEAPLVYDTYSDPDQVKYVGNDVPFEIRTDRQAGVEVGRAGSETFWDKTIDINSTNNTIVFKEDNGHGSASVKILEAQVPEGEYTKETLATVVRNALNEASGEKGYGARYLVEWDAESLSYNIREDGSFDGYLRTQFMWGSPEEPVLANFQTSSLINPDDVNISLLNRDSLTLGTPTPEGSQPLKLTWNGDGYWIVSGNPGYLLPAKIEGTADSVDLDLDESGFADITIRLDQEVAQEGESISFDIIAYRGDSSVGHEMGFGNNDMSYVPAVSDNNPEFITDLTITAGVNDTIDFIETNSTGGVSATLSATITAGNYTDMDALALEIETQLEAASAAPTSGANTIDYAVSYDPETSRFDIREDGSTLNQLQLLWSNTTGASTTAATLGYYPLDDTISYPVSDNTPTHGLITIDNTNNRIDFVETNTAGVATTLTAVVSSRPYTDITDLEAEVEAALNNASAASGNVVLYDVTYDNVLEQFTIQRTSGTALSDFDLLWSSGANSDQTIGDALGYDTSADDTVGLVHSSDAAPVLMTFLGGDNVIDFVETGLDGTLSKEVSISIPPGDYTNLNAVAAEIETAMETASPNGVNYDVKYDYTTGQFMIKGSDADITGFSLLWNSGENASESAASLLGFDPSEDDEVGYAKSDEQIINLVIDGTNNKIDFKEVLPEDSEKVVANLTATVRAKTYTSYTELAQEMEIAMEAESKRNGNEINYTVSYDAYTRRFTIKEDGNELETLHLQWETGENADLSVGGTGQGIGSLIGFSPDDDVKTAVSSETDVEWGVFNTLIDLKAYLTDNDTDGINRTIGRLELNYSNMTSRIVDSGMKYSRLLVRESITSEVSLSMTERKSMIEDADIVESIMKLQSIQTAYQAALSSTSQVLNLSLVDYL